MPSEDRMTINKRRRYLKMVALRYAKAGRGERTELSIEMEAVTGAVQKELGAAVTRT